MEHCSPLVRQQLCCWSLSPPVPFRGVGSSLLCLRFALCRPRRGTTTKLLLVPPKGEQTANQRGTTTKLLSPSVLPKGQQQLRPEGDSFTPSGFAPKGQRIVARLLPQRGKEANRREDKLFPSGDNVA